MKKFFSMLIVLILVSGLSIFAQNYANKGNLELGGDLGFNSTTSVFNGESANESASEFWFNPFAGYFITDGIELGVMPTFYTWSFGDYSENSFGILFAPAYVFNLHSCWYPFIQGRVGYNTSSYDDGDPETNDPSSSGLEWGVAGGVKAQIGEAALINLGLSYTQITMNPENWDGDRIGNNVFGAEVGFTVFLPTSK